VSERRKLSDIGNTVTVHLNRGADGHKWLTEIRMSPEERREFFTEAYKRGWNESREWHRYCVDDGPKGFDEILKDEGL